MQRSRAAQELAGLCCERPGRSYFRLCEPCALRHKHSTLPQTTLGRAGAAGETLEAYQTETRGTSILRDLLLLL